MTPSRRRFLTLFGGSLATAGCAASFQPMGPVVETPHALGRNLITADGARLPLRSWLPPDGISVRGVIVALHGFNDYSFSFDGPGKAFAAQGIATYAFDQRGFGETDNRGIWPGTATLVADVRAAVAVIRSFHPGRPHYLMGESMGGAVSLTALGGPEPPVVDGAIFVAPAVWGFETMGFVSRAALRLAYATLPGMTLHPPDELHIRPSDNIPMLRAMSRDPLVIKGARVDALYGLTELMGEGLAAVADLQVPSLVLFGEKEQVLPEYPVAKALESFGQRPLCRIAVYPHGYHMLLRDLHADVVERDIVSWLSDSKAPLPSGNERKTETCPASCA